MKRPDKDTRCVCGHDRYNHDTQGQCTVLRATLFGQHSFCPCSGFKPKEKGAPQ